MSWSKQWKRCNEELKLLSWNVRSLDLGCPDISDYIQRENPAIVCLQEAFHGHGLCEIEGYNKHVHNTKQGLVTFIDNRLRYKTVKTSPLSNNNNKGNTYMLFRIDMGHKPIYISNVYVEGEMFDEMKLGHLAEYEDVILAGDFNARHSQFPGSVRDYNNWNGRRLVEFVEKYNLEVLGPEMPTHNRGGRIDYIILGGLEEASLTPVRLQELGSDHCALECTIHFC